MGQKPRAEIICRCNNVSRETIEKSIRNGSDTLNKIFDDTSAGVGPCGGSCRRKLKPLLEHYLANGVFPEKIIPDMSGKPITGNEDAGPANAAAPTAATETAELGPLTLIAEDKKRNPK